MRLKTFFFPIMLVISVSIFVGYVWPEILNLKSANEVKMAKEQELKDINAKKIAIDLVGNQISNSEGEKIVKEYLPENRIEERIISNLNYLAESAGVALVNVSLVAGGDTQNAGGIMPGFAGVLNPITQAESAINQTNAGTTTNSLAKSTLQTTVAEISISGSYEKIRMFLDGVAHMPILNTVESIDVTKQTAESADDGTLQAKISVNFGYVGIAKVDGKKVATFKTDMDEETINVLKSYVSQKIQPLEINSGSTGRVNPFVSN